MGTYTVKRGDTLGRIAQQFGMSLNELLSMNPQIDNPDLIFRGQIINISREETGLSSEVTEVPAGDTPWFEIAMEEMAEGVDEIRGPEHNPRIIEYHESTTLRASDDETPWCSAFVNWCVEQAGMEGTKSAAARSWLRWGQELTAPLQRLDRARHVSLTYGAAPLRRPWVPQPGSSEQRALGMPGRFDRALQALVTRALEPAGAAKLSPHTSGFRPGRCWWDAMAAIVPSLKLRPQDGLKVDIANGFDRISHQALLAKTQTFPALRRQRKAWLRAGGRDGERLLPTLAGTPPGGVLSPLAALLARPGMEKAVHQVAPEATVIA